jgi:hypothetical protein
VPADGDAQTAAHEFIAVIEKDSIIAKHNLIVLALVQKQNLRNAPIEQSRVRMGIRLEAVVDGFVDQCE